MQHTAFTPTRRQSMSLRLIGIAVIFLGVSILLVGCGDKQKNESANSVSGKVTFKGDPVSGVVIFVGSDNKESQPAAIKLDGTYTLPDPPTGKVKVLVRTPGGGGIKAPPAMKDGPATGNMPKVGAAAPDKYGAVATSDLTYEVSPGKHTYNIELK